MRISLLQVTLKLPDEWRADIEKYGTPYYVEDGKYVVLEVIVEKTTSPKGFRAHANTIPLYGSGKTKRKAIDNLHEKMTEFCASLPSASS